MLKTNQVDGYFIESECAVEDLIEYCDRELRPEEVLFAVDVQKNIPIYDASTLDLEDQNSALNIMGEWAHNLSQGSGVVVIKNAQPDHQAIDDASAIFDEILQEEAANGQGAGDHFAKAGANGRIWNSLQKLCERAPEVFIRYHGAPSIDTVARAWLGPAYQMTAQVNLVRPGGAAQEAHRDYHLGFMTTEQASEFPVHAHLLSPMLTLQGAIAHVDIPVEAGPTKLLPFSQIYDEGYVAWRRKDFRAYFEENFVQLPLQKGDAIFFNPALLHAGGDNRTSDVQRLVNLLQISSAMGRAMEAVDRASMCELAYEPLRDTKLNEARREAAISALAEGYPFPTNLDLDPPSGGLAPQSQADLLREAIGTSMSLEEWTKINRAYWARRHG